MSTNKGLFTQEPNAYCFHTGTQCVLGSSVKRPLVEMELVTWVLCKPGHNDTSMRFRQTGSKSIVSDSIRLTYGRYIQSELK